METTNTLDAATTPSGKATAPQQLEAATPATLAPSSATPAEEESVFVVHSKALYDDPTNVTPLPLHPVTLDSQTGTSVQDQTESVNDQAVEHLLKRTAAEDEMDEPSEHQLSHHTSNNTYADNLVSTIAEPPSHLSEAPESRLESSVTQPDVPPSSTAPMETMSGFKSDACEVTAPTTAAQLQSATYPTTMSTPPESEASPDFSESSISPLLVVTGPQLHSSGTDTQAVMDAAVVQSHDDTSFSVPTEPEDDTTSRTMLRMGISSTIVEAPSTPQHTELPEGEVMENEEPLTTPTRSPPDSGVAEADLSREITDEVTVITQPQTSEVKHPGEASETQERVASKEEPSQIEVDGVKEGEAGNEAVATSPTSEMRALGDEKSATEPMSSTNAEREDAAADPATKSADVSEVATREPTEASCPADGPVDSAIEPPDAADPRNAAPVSRDKEGKTKEVLSGVSASQPTESSAVDTPEGDADGEAATDSGTKDSAIAMRTMDAESEKTLAEQTKAARQGTEGHEQIEASPQVEEASSTTEKAGAKIEFGVATAPVSEPLQSVVCDLGSQRGELIVEPTMSDANAKLSDQGLKSRESAASVPDSGKVEEGDLKEGETGESGVEQAVAPTAPEIVLSPASGLEMPASEIKDDSVEEAPVKPVQEMGEEAEKQEVEEQANKQEIAEETKKQEVEEHTEKRESLSSDKLQASLNELADKCIMQFQPGAGEDPMVMAVPIAPGRLQEEMQEVVKIQKSSTPVTQEAKSPFKKKRGPSVFTSKPAESQADASAFKAVELPADKPAVYTSTPEPAQVAASALKPSVSPRSTQTVFTNRASRSFADASALSPATPRTQEKAVYESSAAPSRADVTARDTFVSPRSQEKTIFESEARPSYSDTGANSPAPLSARAQRALYEKHASPSNADATATSPQTTVQKKSVFVSQAGPSVASVRHSDEAPMPKDRGVYESKALPSTAHARASDEGAKPAEAVMAFVSHPMPSIADVKSTDPPRVMSRGSSGMFVNEPEPSRSEAKWDASLNVKQEKTIFESTPKVERAADVTWKDPALANPGPPVFVNTPAPSMADTSASRDVEIEDDDEEEEAGDSSVVV